MKSEWLGTAYNIDEGSEMGEMESGKSSVTR